MSIEQRQALDARLRSAPRPASPLSLEQQRAAFAGFMSSLPVPANVRRSPSELAGRPTVVVDATRQGRSGTILYFHGGWFVMGSPDTALAVTAGLVERTGIRAVSLDYRLAPENPYPAAIEDGLAAYRALLADGIDPSSIAFAGDSAGGGLAVTTALSARDSGLPLPAAIVGFSPVLDQTHSGRSMHTRADRDPLFTREAIARTDELYLSGADPAQPLLSPAIAADLRGLPAVLLVVGGNEMLLDDSVLFADRARDAEVDIVVDVTAGVPHVFPAFGEALDEAAAVLDRVALFLTQHIR